MFATTEHVGQICALAVVGSGSHTTVCAASGGQLTLYDLATGRQRRRYHNLLASGDPQTSSEDVITSTRSNPSISGLLFTSDDEQHSPLLCVWGDETVAVYAYEHDRCQLERALLYELESRGLTCRWLPLSDNSTHTDRVLLVGSADGSVQVFTFDRSDSNAKRIAVFRSADATALYCITIHYTPQQALIHVACGTVFGQVLVWTISTANISDAAAQLAQSNDHPIVYRLGGHEGVVFDIAIHQSDTNSHLLHICTVSDDRSARIWQLDTTKHTQTLQHSLYGHTARVFRCLPIDDGQYLATAGEDNTVILWHTESGQRVYAFNDLCGGIWSLAVDKHTQQLAIGCGNGSVRIRELLPHLQSTLPHNVKLAPGVVVRSLQLLDNNNAYCATEDGAILHVDLQTAQVRTLHQQAAKPAITAFMVVEGGNDCIVGDQRGALTYCRDAGDGQHIVTRGEFHHSAITVLDHIPVCDGKYLLSASATGVIALWAVNDEVVQLNAPTVSWTLPKPTKVTAVASQASLHNTTALLVADKDGYIRLYQLHRNNTTTELSCNVAHSIKLKAGTETVVVDRMDFVAPSQAAACCDDGIVRMLHVTLDNGTSSEPTLNLSIGDVINTGTLKQAQQYIAGPTELVAGFYGSQWLLWHVQDEYELMSRATDSMRRAHGFYFNTRNGDYTLVTVQQKQLAVHRGSTSSASNQRLGLSHHGKQSNQVIAVPFACTEYAVFATAGEDGCVKVITYDLHKDCITHVHTVRDAQPTPVKCVAVVATAANSVLLHWGGTYPVHATDLQLSTADGRVTGRAVHRLPTDKFINAINDSNDVRITAMAATQLSDDEHLVVVGDSLGRVLAWTHTSTNGWQIVTPAKSEQHDGSSLPAAILSLGTAQHATIDRQCYVYAGTSRGSVLMLRVQHEPTKGRHEWCISFVGSAPLHQSGVFCLQAVRTPTGTVLISAGDDQSLTCSGDCLSPPAEWQTSVVPNAHFAPIRAMTLLGDQHTLLTSGYDQRLYSWAVDLESAGTVLRCTGNQLLQVADIQSMAGSQQVVAVAGQGMQIVRARDVDALVT